MSAKHTFLKLRKFSNILFTPRYLIYTNTVIGSGSLVVGYGIAEKLRKHFTKDADFKMLNFSKTIMISSVGAIFGIYETIGYHFIDKIKIKKAVYLKLLLDQMFVAPPAVALFLFANEAYDKNYDFKAAVKYTKDSFLPIFFLDMIFWIPAQYINFRFLPHRFRFAYVAGLSIMGNVVLTSLHFQFQKIFEVKSNVVWNN